MGKGGKGGGSSAADAARAEEAARQARVRDGTNQINSIFDGQFNDEFYNGRQQSYLDYATPQFEQQHADAQKQLAYWLDRQGITDSSIRAGKEADLRKLYDTNKRYVADTALNYSNDARNNVEQSRSNLISQLNATSDVSGAVTSANNRAAALTAQTGYSPLGQLFATFTNALSNQAQQEQTAALTGSPSYYNTGLFGPRKDSVVTRK